MKRAADLSDEIQRTMADLWLPSIYRQRVLTIRTRQYGFPSLPGNKLPEIHHTLLGIELKVGRRRMLCPDLATARYLSVFARAGIKIVAIPYDITKISQLADEFESAWQHMLLLADSATAERSSAFRARIRRLLIGKVRDEIVRAGAGPRFPKFKETARHRILRTAGSNGVE